MSATRAPSRLSLSVRCSAAADAATRRLLFACIICAHWGPLRGAEARQQPGRLLERHPLLVGAPPRRHALRDRQRVDAGEAYPAADWSVSLPAKMVSLR